MSEYLKHSSMCWASNNAALEAARQISGGYHLNFLSFHAGAVYGVLVMKMTSLSSFVSNCLYTTSVHVCQCLSIQQPASEPCPFPQRAYQSASCCQIHNNVIHAQRQFQLPVHLYDDYMMTQQRKFINTSMLNQGREREGVGWESLENTDIGLPKSEQSSVRESTAS